MKKVVYASELMDSSFFVEFDNGENGVFEAEELTEEHQIQVENYIGL